MLVNVKYKENFQFQTTARGHAIISDQPLENGGDDAGMTPPELFLAALGSCVGFYAVKYCQARSIDTTGLSIDISAQKTTEAPIRLDELKIHLSLPISLDAHQQKGLESVVSACLIHNTLTHPPKISTQISSAPMSTARSN